ncbi:MAG: radical SAM protein, partial [Lachnospiraceae bacterium]|nr:radical SAM protein [Lachnospiraceae bacterium]
MSGKKGETINLVSVSRIRTKTDGEGVTTLVVSMGCPLRCAYCINPFTWDGSHKGKTYTTDELYNELKIDNLYFLATGGGVMFGGGEPLLNADFISNFIKKYKDTGWKFSMETSITVPKENLKIVIGLIDLFIVDTKDMNKERY